MEEEEEEANDRDALQALLIELRPVPHRTEHATHMDEVKAVRGEGPVLVDVVDLELAIWRHPCRLGGREIGPDDLAFGIGVCEVDRPDPGAGADVEDFGGVGADGGQEELVAECYQEEMVRYVQGIVGLFVVWRPFRLGERSVPTVRRDLGWWRGGRLDLPVFSIFVAVVSTVVLEAVVSDCGYERGRLAADVNVLDSGVVAFVIGLL